MNKNKGFTLIELLVVIAIIGILSSVVLASLSSARNKGKDAAVKSQLASMRAQAEIFYSAGSTYATICTAAVSANGFGGTTGPGLLYATQQSEGVATTINTTLTVKGSEVSPFLVSCHASTDTWVVDAPLVADAASNKMFCVDSAGAAKPEAVAMLASATACL
jgi:prepilin-type N-terminal cleavage/methylation domain-containing protein